MNNFLLESVFRSFAISEIPKQFKMVKTGHINSTYFVECESGNRFVLQKINTYVFRHPDDVMRNVVSVTKHIASKIEAEGRSPEREVLHFIPTWSRNYLYCAMDGSAWRLYKMIEGARSYNQCEFPGLFESAGLAFGRFQKYLSNFPADQLCETIPDFHNTPKRMGDLKESVRKDIAGKASEVQDEIRFVLEREGFSSYIMERLSDGRIPTRVTHNDTKLNNVLIDDDTHEGICVIDLDTVMPGSAVFDFGDAIRYGASNAAEDEKDLSKVFMRLDLFEEFTKGFMSGLGGELTNNELTALPYGAIIITLEVGLRFLADYLDGDVFYRTEYPEHNLDRARTQLKLVADMEQKIGDMASIIQKYAKTR